MKDHQHQQRTRLAAYLQKQLQDRQMTQVAFCRLSGVDQGLLSKVMASLVTSLSLETILKIAVALDTNPTVICDLLDRKDVDQLARKAYRAFNLFE